MFMQDPESIRHLLYQCTAMAMPMVDIMAAMVCMAMVQMSYKGHVNFTWKRTKKVPSLNGVHEATLVYQTMKDLLGKSNDPSYC